MVQRYSSAVQTNYLHKGLETGILTLLPLLEGLDLAGDVGDLLEEAELTFVESSGLIQGYHMDSLYCISVY